MACEKEKKKVADLEETVADLKGQMEGATGAAKHGFARLLKQARDKLAPAKTALQNCLALPPGGGGGPPPGGGGGPPPGGGGGQPPGGGGGGGVPLSTCARLKKKVADSEEKVADLKGQMEGATGAAKHGFARLLKQAQDELARAKGAECKNFTVHFKSLLAIDGAINGFINTQFTNMQTLFSQSNLFALRGTTEDLSGLASLQPLRNLNVGKCRRGQLTSDQNALFGNRRNAGKLELIVYIVSTLIGTDSKGNPANFVGCATHPDQLPANVKPGAVVVQANAGWLVAHEIAHVLGLRHVCEVPACVAGQSDSLMFPNTGWTNLPPDLSPGEFRTMRTSPFVTPFK